MHRRQRFFERNLHGCGDFAGAAIVGTAQLIFMFAELLHQLGEGALHGRHRRRARFLCRQLTGGQAQIERDHHLDAGRGALVHDAVQMDEFRPVHLHSLFQLGDVMRKLALHVGGFRHFVADVDVHRYLAASSGIAPVVERLRRPGKDPPTNLCEILHLRHETQARIIELLLGE